MPKENGENTEIVAVATIPNLHEMTTELIDLTSDYWEPTEIGDTKRCIISEFIIARYEQKDLDLKCIVLVEQLKDGSTKTWKNGSTLLVSSIEKAIENGKLRFFETPIEIIFNGTKKTGTGNSLALWSIKRLVAKR